MLPQTCGAEGQDEEAQGDASKEGVGTNLVGLLFFVTVPTGCGCASPVRHWDVQRQDGRDRGLHPHGVSHAIWQPARAISENIGHWGDRACVAEGRAAEVLKSFEFQLASVTED